MLIALLIVLGIELAVIVAVVALLFARKRWLERQPGAFSGALRASGGPLDGLRPTWKRGSGRWVRDVLVWKTGPLMLRTVVVPADRLSADPARTGGVKRLGDRPVGVRFISGNADIEVAARVEDRELAVGPLTQPPAVPEVRGSRPNPPSSA